MMIYRQNNSGPETSGCATAFVLVLVWSTIVAGCEPRSNLRTTRMKVGEKDFVLEIADDDRSRELGLMNRDSMPANRGMLFVFPREEVRGFWMKNTRFPLDIIYLAADGRVVSIKQMQAFDLTPRSSEFPAQYAIELNQGMAARVGVKAGDKLALPPEIDPVRSGR